MAEETKMCGKCHKVLPVSEFYSNKSKPDGLSGYCKECMKEANHRYKLEKKNKSLVVSLLEKSAEKEKETAKFEAKEVHTTKALSYASLN